MVVQVIFGLVAAVPSKYYAHIALTTVALVVLYAFSQGRTTSRERDLHARVVILTVACLVSLLYVEIDRMRVSSREALHHWALHYSPS